MIKESIAYSVGEFLFKGSRFLLIPFYLHFLNQNQYGVLQQIIILTSFADVFISLAVKQTMLRLYYDYSGDRERAEFLGNLYMLLLIMYVSVAFLSTVTPLYDLVFNFDKLKKSFVLILIYSFSFEILHIGLNLLRIKKLLKRYIQIASLVSILEIIFVVGLLNFSSPTALHRIYGGIAACGIGTVYIFVVEKELRVLPKVNMHVVRNYFSFAIPLSVIGILGWFIVSYDRILISTHFGEKRLAVYGLAYQLASIYKFSQMGFLRAVSVNVYEKISDQNFKGSTKNIGKLSSYIYTIVAFIALLLLYYFAPTILPAGYEEVTSITILFIASKVLLMYYGFNTTFLMSLKDTKSILSMYLISSLIFYYSCDTLIPQYGVMGGVYANMATSIALFILGQTYVHFKYKFNMSRTEAILLLLVVGMVVVMQYNSNSMTLIYTVLGAIAISQLFFQDRYRFQ